MNSMMDYVGSTLCTIYSIYYNAKVSDIPFCKIKIKQKDEISQDKMKLRMKCQITI